METGVMSSGGGEVGELVKDRVQIQRTPAENASVQAPATLADFAPANNVRRACAAFPGAAQLSGKSVSDLTVISAFYEPKSGDDGVRWALDTRRRAASRPRPHFACGQLPAGHRFPVPPLPGDPPGA